MVLKQYPVEDKTSECSDDEAHNLTLTERSAEQADGHERAAKQDETDERAQESTAV